MDVKFNSVVANRLIREMGTYCFGMQKEARELLDIMGNPDGWKDNQGEEFRTNINEIAHELNHVLGLESEYLKTFYQRVKELAE